MLLFWILLGIGVVGFGAGAYWDIKSTEFPDWLPYSMIVAALGVRGTFSLWSGDYSAILNSVMWGVIFLGIGLGMYYTKQWGDGDAWFLGVMGFLFPDSAGAGSIQGATMFGFPFPVVFLFNFFLVAFVYLIVYSIILGVRNPKESGKFLGELKGSSKEIAVMVISFTVVCAGLAYYLYAVFSATLQSIYMILVFPLLLLFVLVFMRYGRFVEANLFKRKIPARKLRIGDVLISDKWRGLTEKEVARLKKKGKPVVIKEGVRFAPVFIITMLLTLFYGNLMVIFFF
jgi:Flp pilus assembly protein protease CpaA